MIFSGLLLVDGSSDKPLASHIEQLCLEAGTNVIIRLPAPHVMREVGHSVKARLEFALAEMSSDIIFVHRDAEAQSSQLRAQQIHEAAQALSVEVPVVPIVPVRMTEAWLLLDESEIRSVAGRPSGREDLDMPKPHEVEGIADPKRLLSDLLLRASNSTGRRRRRETQEFGLRRAVLLERLDLHGPVRSLPSFAKLVADVNRGVSSLHLKDCR